MLHNSITISAPGKLVLFGEHAVIYGYPCIVTAMDQRIKVTIEVINTPEFFLDAPDVHIINYKKSMSDIGKGEIPKGAQFVEIAVKNVLEYISLCHPELVSASSQKLYEQGRSRNKFGMTGEIGIKISTSSEFSSKLGFGSSSSIAVCVIKALSELFYMHLTNKEVFDLAYKTVMNIQKKGSGVDIAAAVYGGTIFFVTGGKIIESIYFSNDNSVIPVSHVIPAKAGIYKNNFSMTINSFPLIVGYSGVKADTVTLINQVKKTFEGKEKELKQIYVSIGEIVEEAKTALLNKDWNKTGELMNKNQYYLKHLGVSTSKLDAMIQAANSNGAYGAKLSGAGGGDCMITLVSKEKNKAVETSIEKAGGKVISVSSNAEGVRVESL